MKIGVISDTHIPYKAKHIPREVLDAFKHVDMVMHAGDMVETLAMEELQGVCRNVVGVYGNMDGESVRSQYPQKQIFKLGRFKVGLIHGEGAPAGLTETLKRSFKDDAPDMIIFGHTHSAFNENINGVIFFNPGSATDNLNCPYKSYGIIEITDKIVPRIIKIKNG